MERLVDGFADDGLERVLALGSDEFRPGPWSGSCNHVKAPGKVSTMRIVVSDFISLDGVVQAPGGPEEDIDDGFRHGGWSMPYFDPDTMGPAVGEIMAATEALLFGRRTWQTMAAAWPARAGDPFADRMN